MPARVSRRACLASVLAAPLRAAISAERLGLIWEGDSLRVAAPRLRFIAGPSLERLKDGASVTYFSQLSLSLDGHATVQARAIDRFVVSYDLWEATFSVAKLSGSRRSASGLSAAAAEAWCLESIGLDASRLAPERPIWVRLDLRTERPRSEETVVGESGINLTRLIEVFSRPASEAQAQWSLSTGPLRLKDIARGPRGG